MYIEVKENPKNERFVYFMYFEMVLEMALACGAVYGHDGEYHVSEQDGAVDFFSSVQMFSVQCLLNSVLMLCFVILTMISFQTF